MRYGLIILTTLALIMLCMTGCNKKEAETTNSDPNAINPGGDLIGNTDPDVTSTVPQEEIAPAPLSEAPYNLAGQALGNAPDAVRPGLSATGLEFDEHWRTDGDTGFIRSQPGSAKDGGPVKASAYFQDGELVCYSQVEETDQAAFDERVAELTAQFGEPVEQPVFVAQSDFMKFFDAEQASVMHCWADEKTETAYIAGLSKDGTRAVYMIMQPKRFDLSQADTMAAMGS